MHLVVRYANANKSAKENIPVYELRQNQWKIVKFVHNRPKYEHGADKETSLMNDSYLPYNIWVRKMAH